MRRLDGVTRESVDPGLRESRIRASHHPAVARAILSLVDVGGGESASTSHRRSIPTRASAVTARPRGGGGVEPAARAPSRAPRRPRSCGEVPQGDDACRARSTSAARSPPSGTRSSTSRMRVPEALVAMGSPFDLDALVDPHQVRRGVEPDPVALRRAGTRRRTRRCSPCRWCRRRGARGSRARGGSSAASASCIRSRPSRIVGGRRALRRSRAPPAASAARHSSSPSGPSSWPSFARSSLRGTMASIIPCSSRNSERWKPSGSFWRMVCSMTRGPGEADERLRLGEDDVAQPGERGRDAAGRRMEHHRDVGLLHLAEARDGRGGLRHLHQREDALLHAGAARGARTRSPGTSSSCARSKTRVTFSPTTEPIEPPMNSKTKQPTETGWPSMRPTPPTNASFSSEVLPGGLEPVPVLLGVGEAERVLRLELRGRAPRRCPSSRSACQPRARRPGHVVAAGGQTFQFFSSSCR